MGEIDDDFVKEIRNEDILIIMRPLRISLKITIHIVLIRPTGHLPRINTLRLRHIKRLPMFIQNAHTRTLPIIQIPRKSQESRNFGSVGSRITNLPVNKGWSEFVIERGGCADHVGVVEEFCLRGVALHYLDVEVENVLRDFDAIKEVEGKSLEADEDLGSCA